MAFLDNAILGGGAEQHNVGFLDDVVLALHPKLAVVFGRFLTASRHQVVIPAPQCVPLSTRAILDALHRQLSDSDNEASSAEAKAYRLR